MKRTTTKLETKDIDNRKSLIVELTFNPYSFDIDYDSHQPYDCNCDYMHRCGTITNVRVSGLPDSLLSCVTVKTPNKERKRGVSVTLSDIELYCIERILRTRGCYDVSNYSVSTVSGYYGQEIGDVSLDCHRQVVNDIKNLLLCRTDGEKIAFYLGLEYIIQDTLLDTIANSAVSIEYITREDAISEFSRTSHRIKRSPDTYKSSEPNIPLAVFIGDNLYDGFYRLAWFLGTGQDKAKIIKIYTP